MYPFSPNPDNPVNVPEKAEQKHKSHWVNENFPQSGHKYKALLLVCGHFSEGLPRNLKWAPLTATSWKPFRAENSRWEEWMQGHVDVCSLCGSFFFFFKYYSHSSKLQYFLDMHFFHMTSSVCFGISKPFYTSNFLHRSERERKSQNMNRKGFQRFFFFFFRVIDKPLLHQGQSSLMHTVCYAMLTIKFLLFKFWLIILTAPSYILN